MALGKNIEHLRKLAGLTRKAVARGIGLEDDQAIYAMETRDSVRSEYAPALAKYFLIDLGTLVTQDITGLGIDEVAKLRTAPSEGRVATASLADAGGDSFAVPLFAEQAAELIRLFGMSSPTGRNAILETARSAAATASVSSQNIRTRNEPQ